MFCPGHRIVAVWGGVDRDGCNPGRDRIGV